MSATKTQMTGALTDIETALGDLDTAIASYLSGYATAQAALPPGVTVLETAQAVEAFQAGLGGRERLYKCIVKRMRGLGLDELLLHARTEDRVGSGWVAEQSAKVEALVA